ncbi:MAG: glycosyltransferase family 10 [Nibricoccus sp.]
MTLVRIVKSWTKPDLLRQTPGGTGVLNDIRFTLDPVERCDYLIVLNHVPEKISVEVPPENIWCFIQEPPLSAYRCFEKGFPHYSRVFTQDPRLRGRKFVHTHGSLPWHVGRSYDELRASPPPEKTKDLAWITSNLGAHKGHRLRLQFLDRLRKSDVPFDLFGRGFNPVADKSDGLAAYRYAIAVENHSCPDYWTEKIADCYLAGAMPIYFGATNLKEFFPAGSFVWLDITDPDAPRRVAEIIASDQAEKNRDAIAEARRRVLEDHNLFPRLARLIADDLANRPKPASRHVELPHIPDSSVYHLYHTPLQRLGHAISRRLHLPFGRAG